MKNLKLFTAIIIALTMGLASCTKEGAVGPAGAAGSDGNANAKTVFYADVDWPTGSTTIRIEDSVNLTSDAIENDVILLYGVRGVFTYPIPGPYSGLYFVRNYYFNSGASQICYIKAQDFDGSIYAGTPTNFDEIKMVYIKSNTSVTAIKQLEEAGIDLNNYQAVENYFGIE